MMELEIRLSTALRVEHHPSLGPVVNHHCVVEMGAEQVVAVVRYARSVEQLDQGITGQRCFVSVNHRAHGPTGRMSYGGYGSGASIVPDPCQNEQSLTVRSGHSRRPLVQAELGERRFAKEPKRSSKQGVPREFF